MIKGLVRLVLLVLVLWGAESQSSQFCDVFGSTVSQFQPQVMRLDLLLEGKKTPTVFVVDLCRATYMKPSPDAGWGSCCDLDAGMTSCSQAPPDPYFFGLFTPKNATAPEECRNYIFGNTLYSLNTNGVWSAVVTGRNLAYIAGHCGTNEDLKAVGDVIATRTAGDSLTYNFTFVSKAFCVPYTPSPGSTPVPPSPPAPPSPPLPPTPPAPMRNGTVTQLKCRRSDCSDCSGTVLPIGNCVSRYGGESVKATLCDSRQVTLKSWSASRDCGSSFADTTLWPTGRCIRAGDEDYRFYSCSP